MGTQKEKRPVLTIGMIFKNEIRCLERCLESLSPLREAVPCELVMADTGSDDGSRETAARYADILFDFPWVNDFSAARNAVMEKASGRWYMTVDADEYLDDNVAELADFLRSEESFIKEGGTVIQRNYDTHEMDSRYSDFMAMRLLRLSTGLRYNGAIHESWHFTSGNQAIKNFTKIILHHDGYVNLNDEEGKAKRERNLALIKRDLARNPDSLRNLLQYLESGVGENDYTDTLRYAAELVEKKYDTWECLGPSIFRYAVQEARSQGLAELEEWVGRARKWFPDSFLTRIDVEYIAFTYNWEKGNYAACISGGERYLKALADYRGGRGDIQGLMYGSFFYGTALCEQSLMIYMSEAYMREGRPERSVRILERLDCAVIQPDSVENLMRVLWKIHVGGTDAAPALLHFYWEGQKPLPDETSAGKRMDMFYQTALRIFMLREEEGKETVPAAPGHPPYALFLPLGDECEPGLAARIMDTNDVEDIRQMLMKVGRWDRFPVEALSHALEQGIPFPPAKKPLKLEEAESLSARIAADRRMLYSLLRQIKEKEFSGSFHSLAWNRQLVRRAVRICNWRLEEMPGHSALAAIGGKMGLARLYAEIEGQFLPCYYAPGVLCEENLFVLPAYDRFGWYYIQAFYALDSSNPAEYIHELKAGLKVCTEMSAMVEYLIKNTPQLQETQEAVSEELMALASQVKNLLSAYPADDPAVMAVKASPAYKKVAKLIEG